MKKSSLVVFILGQRVIVGYSRYFLESKQQFPTPQLENMQNHNGRIKIGRSLNLAFVFTFIHFQGYLVIEIKM